MKLTFFVSSEIRLDKALMSFVTMLPSRTFATKLIENNFVTVNNRIRTKAGFLLKNGDEVLVDLSLLEQKSAPLFSEDLLPQEQGFDVIFEDEHILVIDKKAGVVVHPGAGHHGHTLVQSLYKYCGSLPSLGGEERAGLVHRLDRDTSGVMVVAKTQIALTQLSTQFSKQAKTRYYHALCYGIPPSPSGIIETNHGRDPKNRIKFKVLEEGGKVAKSEYQTRETFHHKYSLIECHLFTGRTHQIRVQLEHIKCPVIGDSLYTKGIKSPRIKAHRQMLHATSLSFQHPVSHQTVTFEAPWPPDFQTCLESLKER